MNCRQRQRLALRRVNACILAENFALPTSSLDQRLYFSREVGKQR